MKFRFTIGLLLLVLVSPVQANDAGDNPATGKPSCDETHRGWRWHTASGPGVADTFEACQKNAADGYAWVRLDSAGGGAAAWGDITGTLSAQTDLQTALDGKEASGTFSGVGACAANQWASTLNDTAAPSCTQPGFSNLSGAATDAQVPNTITIDLAAAATALAANGGNCSGNNFALGVDASGVGECAQPAFSNLSGTATDAQLASSYSGVGACAANQWASTLSDNAAPTCTQPGFSNLSGTPTVAQGGTTETASTEDAVLVGASTTDWVPKVLPDCDNGTTSKLLYDQATNAFSCGTDQTGGGGGTWTTVKKTADEQTTADTTLTNDNTLVAALSASTAYRLKWFIWGTTANATMDYKYAVSYSGTTTEVHCKRRHVAAGTTTAGTDLENTVSQASILGSTAVTATSTGDFYVEIDCIVEANAAGTIAFQWAQNTSDAGALIIKHGSYLEHATF